MRWYRIKLFQILLLGVLIGTESQSLGACTSPETPRDESFPRRYASKTHASISRSTSLRLPSDGELEEEKVEGKKLTPPETLLPTFDRSKVGTEVKNTLKKLKFFDPPTFAGTIEVLTKDRLRGYGFFHPEVDTKVVKIFHQGGLIHPNIPFKEVELGLHWPGFLHSDELSEDQEKEVLNLVTKKHKEISRARAMDMDMYMDMYMDMDMDMARAWAKTRARARAWGIDIDISIGIDRAWDRARARARDIDMARAWAWDIDMARARDRGFLRHIFRLKFGIMEKKMALKTLKDEYTLEFLSIPQPVKPLQVLCRDVLVNQLLAAYKNDKKNKRLEAFENDDDFDDLFKD